MAGLSLHNGQPDQDLRALILQVEEQLAAGERVQVFPDNVRRAIAYFDVELPPKPRP